ncbi:hypothetical protein [Streptomyces sp. NPDC050534]|uniref:hypothetical protein n=1 Tax=Streptomyces sp. NPDC050534 TaxID=3365625 RepID=UPI003797166D
MNSHPQRIHGRGPRVLGERNQTSEIVVKFVVLAGLLYLVVRVFEWGVWIPFAGASVYLLWEISRINSALGELAHRPNRQYHGQQNSGRDEFHGTDPERDDG